MQKTHLKTRYTRKIPISIWEEETSLNIPIRQPPSKRPAHADWATRWGLDRPRAQFIFLNRPYLAGARRFPRFLYIQRHSPAL